MSEYGLLRSNKRRKMDTDSKICVMKWYVLFQFIISICWFAGSIVGFLPLMGWHQDSPSSVDCFFLSVMDYHYLTFLYFGTIITPALLLAAFYAHIYRVVLKQLRQIVVMNPDKSGGRKSKNLSSGGMIRMLGVHQRNEVKSTQNLAIIVLFFMICWIPLYTINCIITFYKDFSVNSTFMLSCIILSHLNSAGNPLLYAYHLRDFRAALKNFFCNILGFPQHQCCDQFPPRYTSNYSQNKLQYRNSSRSSFDCSKRILACRSQVGEIVKNSAVLAAAPATKIDRSIWNIPEDSGRDSGSSQDSFKDIDSSHHDKLLMIRPATPYKTNNILKDVNLAYEDSSSHEDSDDAFVNDNFSSYFKKNKETCLSDVVKTQSPMEHSSYSKSSPQLSKEIFLIENESKKHTRCVPDDKKQSFLCVNNNSPKSSHRLSPYKLMSNLFKNKRKLNRSLSDSDSLKKWEGVMSDYYSVPM